VGKSEILEPFEVEEVAAWQWMKRQGMYLIKLTDWRNNSGYTLKIWQGAMT